jgi:hypothetical protein
MTAAKYAVFRTPEGTLRITHTDGSPIPAETVDWFRVTLRDTLRAEGLSRTLTHRQGELIAAKRASADSIDEPVARFRVDEAVVFLEEERKKLGIRRAALAKLLFMQTQRLTDYARGWARPTIETLRVWAFMLGWNWVMVPNELKDSINKMVADWVTERDSKLPEVE